MIIRQMTNEDLNDLIEIWLAASKEAHHFIPAEYWESKQGTCGIYIFRWPKLIYWRKQAKSGALFPL